MNLQKVLPNFMMIITESVIQEYKEDGVNMYELSEDEKAQWHRFYREIEENWVKGQNSPNFEATLKAFREAAKKYK